jgi:riboflavin kinase/FMN adenylyltransferase
MRIVHSSSELKGTGHKSCLAIGFFDGVHLGHQQIIRQTIADARQHEALAVVITFDQHPNVVVAPQRVPPMIYSLPQKLRTIAEFGPEALFLIHFDKAFSQQTGEDFIRGLSRDAGRIQSICVGSNFTFGNKRGGNVALLKQLGAELQFTVHGMAAVALDRKPVSSTRIREALQSGDLDAAGQMLGRAWSLAGKVMQGDRLGHQLGFPTANLDATGLALPPDGVYAVHAQILKETEASTPTPDTRTSPALRAVLNIGLRPTIKTGSLERRVEAHLLDFQGDLYGKQLELTFVQKLRDEKKFGSLQELQAQIGQDIQHARTLF